MELYIYNSDLILYGVIDEITSLMWTRRYWKCGEFKLLVPFSEKHIELLIKKRLIMKRGDEEAGEINYINIRTNSQGLEEIEVQGRFITNWLSKRIALNQIITTDNTPNILRRIVSENVINPYDTKRIIPNIHITGSEVFGRDNINYASEPFINTLLACEMTAIASKLGFCIAVDVKKKKYYFKIYDGKDLTADQSENPPCIFSQEFDNVMEQEYTNSVENLKSIAYVGGEEIENEPRTVVEVSNASSGLERNEVFIDAPDITQSYRNSNGDEVFLTDTQYFNMLYQRGVSELEHYTETLSFTSKINTHANLKYKEDFNLGDRVTCVNKRWGVKINVRITEIIEIYQKNINEMHITFGESLPTLIDKLRQILK